METERRRDEEFEKKQNSMLESLVQELNNLIGNQGKVVIYEDDIVISDGSGEPARCCYIKQRRGIFKRRNLVYLELPWLFPWLSPDSEESTEEQARIQAVISVPEVFDLVKTQLERYAHEARIGRVVLQRDY